MNIGEVKIAKSKSELKNIVDLRYKILREPWQQAYDSSSDELEESSVNAYIKLDEKIVACGRLQNNGSGIGQIRYMAVDSNQQGKGLGKLILKKLEEEAVKIGLKTIELQARENALEFYKANNYTIVEKSFKLWDIIQHYKMAKQLND